MGLLLLEALAVLGIAIFIVWWTMFSGRPGGEAKAPDELGVDAGLEGTRGEERERGRAASGSGESAGRSPGAD